MKTTILLIFSMILGLVTLRAEEPEGPVGLVRVKVVNLKNGNGDLRFTLFNSKNGFPGKTEQGFRRGVITAEGQEHQFLFEKLPYGTYAVAVVHDENRNGKLDTNFLGMPREGVGVSNNPKSKFGPPSFDDAKFSLDRPEVELEIRLR